MTGHNAHPLNLSLVRIRRTSDCAVVGTAFLIAERIVCTCAHVVAEALEIGQSNCEQPPQEILLDFPTIPNSDASARVIVWSPEQYEDVAVLELTSEPPSETQPAQIVDADCVGQNFEVWGYPRGNEQGGMARGTISYATPSSSGWIQIEDTKMTGYRIQPGFSGAPVWVPELGVVGMIVVSEKVEATKVAYMIPVQRIQQIFPNLEVQGAPLPTVSRNEPVRVFPRVWNVPHFRNQSFAGRADKLSELHHRLASSQPGANVQVVTGLGGMGKTQLVVEYLYQYAADYDIAWWIHAEEPATLASDFADLATELDLPEQALNEQPEIVDAVKKYLRQHERWALVFDGAPVHEQVSDYLIPGGRGHILITSINELWGQIQAVQLGPLSLDEAASFLIERTGQPNHQAASAIASEMDGLPLALEQAASYVTESKTTLASYLDLFQKRRRDLWPNEHSPHGYKHTVATTWNIAMERMAEESPTAASLMNLFAFLAPNDIPRFAVIDASDQLPEPLATAMADPIQVNAATKALRSYSLADVRGESYSVHQLVQAVTRDRLPYDEELLWSGAAVRMVDRLFPSESGNVSNWPVYAQLLPHALATAGYTEALGVEPDSTGRLLNNAGLYLKSRVLLSEAKSVLERALHIGEQSYGPEHPTVAIRLSNLALVLKDLGQPADAQPLLERALHIDEQCYGPEHPTVAIRLGNLATVLQDLGQPAEAKPLLENALHIGEQSYGPDHPTVAIRLSNLALVLQDLGQPADAKPLLERALHIDEQSYGPDHPTVAVASATWPRSSRTSVNLPTPSPSSNAPSISTSRAMAPTIPPSPSSQQPGHGPQGPRSTCRRQAPPRTRPPYRRAELWPRPSHRRSRPQQPGIWSSRTSVNLPTPSPSSNAPLDIDEQAAHGPEHPNVAIRPQQPGIGPQGPRSTCRRQAPPRTRRRYHGGCPRT